MGVREIEEWKKDALKNRDGSWNDRAVMEVLCRMRDNEPADLKDSNVDRVKLDGYVHLVEIACQCLKDRPNNRQLMVLRKVVEQDAVAFVEEMKRKSYTNPNFFYLDLWIRKINEALQKVKSSIKLVIEHSVRVKD